MPRRVGNGAGHGPGHGGPAKGAGRGGDAKPFTADSPTREWYPGGKGDPMKMAARADRREIRRQRVEEIEDHLYDLALNAERQETQVLAATRLHAIYEGQPVARQITANVDDVSRLNDDDLRNELARLGGAATGAASGDAAARVPGEPGDVVH